MYIWPTDSAMRALEHIPEWTHGIQDWFISHREKQMEEYKLLESVFKEWTYQKRKSFIRHPNRCILVFVASLDILVIMGHVLYPFIIAYLAWMPA